MLVSITPKVGNDVIYPCSIARETIYPRSRSLKGVAVAGLMQELIKHLSEDTECLQSDAMGVYNPNRYMAVVAVRG